MRVLITGCKGYIGSALVDKLATHHKLFGIDIVAADGNELYHYECCDIRDPRLSDIVAEWKIEVIVHLASVMIPGQDESLEYDIDVNGTRNVVNACIDNRVSQLCVTSSGAAYGYYSDNAPWLSEDDALRGNREFSYAWHKRVIEEMIARTAREQPWMKVLVFRPGTVLGSQTRNQITKLFEAKFVLGIVGSKSPFVFIWDQDVVDIMVQGVEQGACGVYNLAGDGSLDITYIAKRLGKPILWLPAWVLRGALRFARILGLTHYGPEQVDFLRYRPVLSNRKLKEVFGYEPKKTSSEVFDYFVSQRQKLEDGE